jgi:hypothetical protein
MRRIAVGLWIARGSGRILRRNRKLIVLPLISLLTALVAGAILFAPPGIYAAEHHSALALLPSAVAGVYVLSFTSVFFRVAFVEVASGGLDGEPTSVSAGLRLAWARLDAIGWWALAAASVGILLGLLEQLPGVGRIAAWVVSTLIGVAWGALTSFVVPVLALEPLGARAAVKRSAAIFRERWGEEATGAASISAAFVIASVPVIALIVVGAALTHRAPAAAATIVALGVIALLALSVLSTTLQQLFLVVLYRYATGRGTPDGFGEDQLRRAVG